MRRKQCAYAHEPMYYAEACIYRIALMPSAVGNSPSAAPRVEAPAARPAPAPGVGPASTLASTANEPRVGLMSRIGHYLVPLGQRITSAFVGIGNACCARPAPYDMGALDTWVRGAVAGEDRAEAAERIRAGLRNGLADLSDLQLRTLPPLPARLIELRCGHNALTELPALPAGLQILSCSGNPIHRLPALPPSLLHLDVGDCPLATLPPLPVKLIALHAARCGFAAMPPEWPSTLIGLNLRGNRIAEIGRLPTGWCPRVDLRDNLLTSLPGNLRDLSRSGDLYLEGNALDEQALGGLMRLTGDAAYRGPRVTFSTEPDGSESPTRLLREAVSAWYGTGTSSDSVQYWAGFAGETGAPEFARYLDRLAGSINAKNDALAGQFKAHIGEWLAHLAAEPTLREETFAIVAPGNERCEDRATLMLLQMTRLRVNHDVAAGRYDSQPTALLAAVQGSRRLEALEAIAIDKMRTMGAVDDVEVILAYPVDLRERLELPIGVQAMRYPKLSNVSSRDLDRAEAQVKALDATFHEYLASDDSFHRVLGRWAAESFEQARTHLNECMVDGTYETRVQARIASVTAALSNDPIAISQAGRAVLAELRHEVFGPLVRAYLDKDHLAGAQTRL
jgi:hypothetical protein